MRQPSLRPSAVPFTRRHDAFLFHHQAWRWASKSFRPRLCLKDCHAPLAEHTARGQPHLHASPARLGALAEEISAACWLELVPDSLPYWRVVYIWYKAATNIDVAFLGVPSCDEFGNANGYTGSGPGCGSLGYAVGMPDSAKQVVMPDGSNYAVIRITRQAILRSG